MDDLKKQQINEMLALEVGNLTIQNIQMQAEISHLTMENRQLKDELDREGD